jgi:hypothetical protein
MANLENREQLLWVCFTHDEIEQIRNYQFLTGNTTIEDSTHELVKLGLKSLESPWIKFSEQLPPENKSYLVTDSRNTSIAKYYSPDSWDIEQGYCNGSWLDDSDCGVTVTHWQELPLPPVKGGDS